MDIDMLSSIGLIAAPILLAAFICYTIQGSFKKKLKRKDMKIPYE